MSKIFARILFVVALAGPALAQTPNVNDNGVVNGGNFKSPVAPGSIVSIFGTNFASSVAVSSTVPLSTSLGGASVSFNGRPAPLFFVGPMQINAQLPAGLSGDTVTVTVTGSGGTSAGKPVQISQATPAIFTVNQAGTQQGWVLFANSTDVAAPTGALEPNFHSRPAKAGDVLTIYVNGLGPVSPPVADGNNTLDGLRTTTLRPVVTVGSVTVPDANILFSGLAPQFVALYQINFTMPAGVSPGNTVPIQIAMGGMTSSNQVTIAVQ